VKLGFYTGAIADMDGGIVGGWLRVERGHCRPFRLAFRARESGLGIMGSISKGNWDSRAFEVVYGISTLFLFSLEGMPRKSLDIHDKPCGSDVLIRSG
jgi:hypothetical protein